MRHKDTKREKYSFKKREKKKQGKRRMTLMEINALSSCIHLQGVRVQGITT